MKYFQINDSNKDIVLRLFNKTTDSEGYIIEKRTSNRIVCPYTNQNIKVSDFSILPGSATFVNNRPFCFAEHRARH